MKLTNILPSNEQLELVKGIEGQLLDRKQMEKLSGLVAIAAVVIQVIIAVGNTNYLEDLGSFFINLSQLQFDPKLFPEFIGILIVAIAVGIYLLLKRTSFLIKESEKPFQYTFWIEPFKLIEQVPEKRFTVSEHDQHTLLHHDISERINQRIKRFSLLNEGDLSDDEKKLLTSHVHISGDYAIREEEKERWVIYVTSRVRVGRLGSPETLSHLVKFPLEVKKDSGNIIPQTDLDADEYNQLIERVYSSVATEIYRRILSDVKEKVTLFPTNYLRYVALFHEAKDFERSNTVDAYDHAIELYQEAVHYFETRLFGWKDSFLLNLPLLWRLVAKSTIMEANMRIGYSRCRINRKILSRLSGRRQNTLYGLSDEIQTVSCSLIKLHNRINRSWILEPSSDYDRGPKSLDTEEVPKSLDTENRYKAITSFLTFPHDSALRRRQSIFDRQRKSLFDAYTVGALTYSIFGDTPTAQEFLESAKATDPIMSQKNPHWLLTKSYIVPKIDEKLYYLQQAVESVPSFDIALYDLAQCLDKKLRIKNEINYVTVASVIDKYNQVLRINPGIIATLVAQGYLHWLVGDLKEAEEKFKRGLQYKAIVSETFTADLNYGLARIAAEKGLFDKSFGLYMQAISADPDVASNSPNTERRVLSSFYEYMTQFMLLRNEKFKKNVHRKVERLKAREQAMKYKQQRGDAEKMRMSKTIDAAYSFVLNDYGNACLNYFTQFGKPKSLDDAILALKEAINLNRDNVVAYSNLLSAYSWKLHIFPSDESEGKMENCLKNIERLGGDWNASITRSIVWQSLEKAQKRINGIKNDIKPKKEELKDITAKKEELKKQIDKPEDIQESRQNKGIPEKSIEESLNDYDEKLKSKTNEIEKLEKDLELKQDEFKNLFRIEIDKLMSLTTFASINKRFQFSSEGDGVSDFLK